MISDHVSNDRERFHHRNTTPEKNAQVTGKTSNIYALDQFSNYRKFERNDLPLIFSFDRIHVIRQTSDNKNKDEKHYPPR